MGTTTRGYPYPEPADDTDVPGDMQALAEAVDADQRRYVIKSGDESVTSSTTLQNDDALFIDVEAGATYEVGGLLFVTNGGGRIKIAWDAPSLSAMQWAADGVQTAATAAGTIDPLAFNTPTGFVLHGRLVPGGAGTLRLRWAQFVADVDPTTVLSGSFIWIRRIS